MRTLPVLISVVLLAGCGQTDTAPGNEGGGGAPAALASIDAVEAATATVSVATAPTQGAAEKPVGVAALPLKRGFYVVSDTPCGQASNATLNLLQRDGIGGARDFCKFGKIEKTGASTYRVTETCGDLQAGPESEETRTAVWTITKDNSYSRKTSEGWESSARYCAQSSLPDDWRDNDISDLIR